MLKVGLAFVCCICLSKSEAPYPPSGYRPQGRQFELPQNFEQNSNLQPQSQYGTPDPPPNQYLPVEPPSGGRLKQFERQQNNLQPQSQYGTPNQTPPPHQYLPSKPSSEGRFNNFEGQHQPSLQPQTPILNQLPSEYLPSGPSAQGRFNNFEGQHQPQTPILKALPSQYFPKEPSSQGTLNNFERHEATTPQINRITKNGEAEAKSGRQNYLPPSATKRTRQRGYPEQTTKRPKKQDEPTEEQEFDNPNVAISTAVANGQYYLVQPSAVLPRKQNQNEEDLKSNGLTAKLIYQNVNPLSSPFYTQFIAI